MFRPLIRSLATLIAGVCLATCADAPSVATPSAAGRFAARVGFEPVFSLAAKATAAKLADFGISFDHVRVVIVRPVADTVKDTTIAFTPTQADVTLDLTVAVRADGESFQVGIDYTNAGGVVFHGAGTVQSHRADQPAPAQQITVQYVGPGASVTRLVVSPKTTSLVSPSTLLFTANGFDANNALVAGTPVSWTTSDPSIATISTAGALATTGKRGTVTVTATTPNNVTDNASVTVTLPAAAIALVSGGGQTGKAGSALPQPGVVKVTASDGVGVVGVPVNFAPPNGGKVGSTIVTTDANGLASTVLTLGGGIGPQSFAAVASGFTVAIPETATGGDPGTIVALSGSAQSDTVGRALKLPLVAKVTDQFGNPLANIAVTWTRTAGSGGLSGSTSVTGADGLASINYTLGGAAGTETITASVAGSATAATFTETALAGQPAAVAPVSGGGQTGRVLLPLAPFVVKVIDAAGNPVAGVPVAWTVTNGTLRDANTTTDAFGQTSNVMTPGTAVGAATATATLQGGKSVTFSVNVGTGPLGRMAFLTGPPPVVPVLTAIVPSIRVALQDAGGNLTGSTNAVTIALGANTGGATLTGTLTRNAVAGIATFDDLRLDKLASGYTLIASSAAVASITSTPFAVGPAAARSLVIVAGDGQSGIANGVSAVLPAVRIADSSGNAIVGAPVTFTPASGSGTVLPATPVLTDSAGIARLTSWTFGIVAGPQSLVASSPGVPSATIHATVAAGAPARIVVVTQPSTTAASGAVFAAQPVVQLQDANGNPSKQSGVAITATIATGGGTLSGTVTAITDTAGRAQFVNLKINGIVGARTLAFSSPSVNGTTSTSIAVTAGAAAKLVFTVNPTNAVANGGITPPVAVTVEDADGNVISTATNTVTLSITSGTGPSGAQLGGTTSMAAVNGVATFPELSINSPSAGYSLTASSQGLTSAVSTTFVVEAPAGPTRIVIVTQPPATVASGAVFATQPVVQLQDAGGNVSKQSGVSITATIATGGGTLTGSVTGVTDTTGRAQFFNLKINGIVGARTLAFSSPNLTGATSTSIAVTAGAAAKLAFTVNPSNAPANAAITPPIAVAVEDADGNVVPTATNVVGVSLTPGTAPPGATLTTSSSPAAVNGVATFPNVSIDTPSSGYTLTASSQGLTSAVSTTFTITASAPSVVAAFPSLIDAVFSSVPVKLAGTKFVTSATTVTVSGGNITTSNTNVLSSDTLSTFFNVVGGAPTSTPNITVTTAAGASAPLPFALYSVGAAPVQLGPLFGDSGGSPYSLDCPAEAVVTALNVRGGANVDQLQLSCQTVTGAARVFGEPQFTEGVGGTGGSPTTLACPSNFVMVGLTGRIGTGGSGLNDMIAGLCMPIGGGNVVSTSSVGSNFSGSIAYTATCPVGLVLTGVQGGAGNLLDRTQIKCR